jgi:hypothetical protein
MMMAEEGWSMLMFDDKNWPLIVATFSPNVSTTEVRLFYFRHERVLERQQRYLLLIDSTDVNKVSDSQFDVVKLSASWHKKNADALRQFNMGTAVVIKNPILRAVMKATGWMQPFPYPCQVRSDVDEARDWLAERGRHMRLELPATLHV